jgi:hypothetical protein
MDVFQITLMFGHISGSGQQDEIFLFDSGIPFAST